MLFNRHFIMFMGSVSQKCRGGTVGMSCVCSMMFGISARMTQMAPGGWNHLEVPLPHDWHLGWVTPGRVSSYCQVQHLTPRCLQCPESERSKRIRWKLHGLLWPSLWPHTISLLLDTMSWWRDGMVTLWKELTRWEIVAAITVNKALPYAHFRSQDELI